MTDRQTTPANKANPLIDEWLRDLPDDLASDLREEYEERAGILQFDGGLSRECAEWAALALLARRHPLKLLGLRPVDLGAGRYALVPDVNPLGLSAVPASLELAELIRACGPVVLLSRSVPEN